MPNDYIDYPNLLGRIEKLEKNSQDQNIIIKRLLEDRLKAIEENKKMKFEIKTIKESSLKQKPRLK